MEFSTLFRHQITPHVLGILWLTEKDFSAKLENYHNLNYFVDGLFSSQIQPAENQSKQKRLFLTESFGRPFFISHIKQTQKTELEIKNLLDLAQNFQGSKDIIFYIDEIQQFTEEKWKIEYPQLKFKRLLTE